MEGKGGIRLAALSSWLVACWQQYHRSNRAGVEVVHKKAAPSAKKIASSGFRFVHRDRGRKNLLTA
jgi:hypothetical protein